ncbi:hypothetical protein E2123_26730 [Escherichia coli]|nr:hypothetical protein [Escherichia coli O21]MDN1931648.1 hypothetical protein [Escherichia coli]RXA95523.1 hypothetical protein EO240_26740 [Escherichia coli]TEV41521.1 hypothetical protein E2130_26790 [Escherichia coli]TEV96886.1 hypothetical protein E2123_26730 [Escherichia coli]
MKVVCCRVVWQKDKSPVVNFSLTHEAPACLDNIRIASYRALRKEKKAMKLPRSSLAYFHERRSLNNFHRDRVITFEQIAE